MSRKPVSENVTEFKKKFNPSLHTLLLSAPISCLKSNIRLIIFSNLTTEPLVHTETEWHETALCCSLLPVLRSRSTSGNTGIRYCWIGCHENRRVNRLTLSDAQVFTLCNSGQSSDLVLIGRGGGYPIQIDCQRHNTDTDSNISGYFEIAILNSFLLI